MITLFNSETAYIGTDIKKFNEMRDYLELHKIKYKYKTTSRMGSWTGHGVTRSLGTAGNSMDSLCEYEILVHKKDYEKVRLWK